VSKINQVYVKSNIKFEIVKQTGSSLGRLLFNNNDGSQKSKACGDDCTWCPTWEGDQLSVKSNVNRSTHKIDGLLGCTDSGIYAINAKCGSQYIGKTTAPFHERLSEHLSKENSTLNEHVATCNICDKDKFEMQFLENVWKRGKFSLSEREYLWNARLKGVINIQKTLKK